MSEAANTFQMDRFSTRPDEELKQLQFDIDIDPTIMPDDDTIQMNTVDAMATSNKPNSDDLQTSMIDCALEDLEDEEDLKFEDINFDAADEEFGGLPSLLGPSWMPAHGFGFNIFDHLQFGMLPTHQHYSTGFGSVPQIHPAPPEMAYHTYHDLFPSTGDMFSSAADLCDEQHHYRRPLKKRKVDKSTFDSPVPFDPRFDGPLLDPLSAQLHAHEHYFPKMPIKECAAVDMSPSAVAAREARKARRIARAKDQVLFLLDATVSDIEEAAVVDADYNDPFDFDQTHGVQVDHLLRDYMRNFDAKAYVASVWDGVYSSLLMEKNEVDRKVKVTTTDVTPDLVTSSSNNTVAANLINLMRKNSCISLNIPIDVSSEISSTSSSNTPRLHEIRDTPFKLGTPKSQDIPRQNHIVTPTSSDNSRDKKRSLDECNVAHPMPLPFVPCNLSIKTPPSPPPSPPTSVGITLTKTCSFEEDDEMYPDLPRGNDPESRRMRRLLRNRLSAQKSRDRRRKEIEGYKKLKVEKDGEIASLKKTLTEEMAALKKLEEMVNFAKNFLGPAKFATVVN